MVLEQKLQLKLTQKLVMTPTLQQAIKLLQLSRLELEQALGQELQVNPLLEVTDETPDDDAGTSTADELSIPAAHTMHILSSVGEGDPGFALAKPEGGKRRPMVQRALENYERYRR